MKQLPPEPPDVPPPSPRATTKQLSEKEKVQEVAKNDDFLVWSGVLVGICLLAAVVFYFLDRWRKRTSNDDDNREAAFSLSQFRELYENGEITETEYVKVRDRLAAQMKSKLGVTPKPIDLADDRTHAHNPQTLPDVQKAPDSESDAS